ncbi:DUF4832 domain-containing protein [Streptomyces sp. NPDC002779]|uniref:DUF4832 domain-containing protein n=1 Tax=Streptomyces sp. NPDC002779 TaxID=3364664 RepID=UPI0036D1B5E7
MPHRPRLFALIGALLLSALLAALLPASATAETAATTGPAGPPPRPPGPAPADPRLPTHQLPYAPGPLDNPLKGFAVFQDQVGENPYPHSIEWVYLSLSEVINDPKNCRKLDFTLLEEHLDRAAAGGNQVAMRFYMNYPGGSGTHPENGLPPCLKDSVDMRWDEFWKLDHPDYDNPKLMATLENFIDKLGRRYDGDPRLGYLTLGLIGLWGEWHTWPYDTDTADGYPNYMPSLANQRKVIGWMDRAFDTTMVEARYPELADGAVKNADFGLHDDSFCFIEGGKGVTLPESMGGAPWSQMAGVLRAGMENRWTTNSMGGEVRPEIQPRAFENWPTGNGADVDDMKACIELEHSTWKINHYGVNNYAHDDPKVAEAVRLMGYELHATKAHFKTEARDRLDVGVTVENLGVAPFYYNWPVEIGLRDRTGRVVRTWETSWDLRKIQPLKIRAFPDWQTDETHLPFGHPQYFQTGVDLNRVESGDYQVVMRVVNPLPTGKKLRFANAAQGEDGWLSLGHVKVRR